MKVRLLKASEIDELFEMIKRSIEQVFPLYYPSQSITYVLEELVNKSALENRMNKGRFYVAEDRGKIVGCGCIAKHINNVDGDFCLLTFFVDPAIQGKGIGKAIVKACESDEMLKKAKRIEVPSSIPALPFYKRIGYEHRNGELNYEDGHFWLEKIL